MKQPTRIHLDLIGGIAGDMFVAALADAFEDLRTPLLECLSGLSMPVPAHAHFETHADHSLLGLRFDVHPAGQASRGRMPAHTHAPHTHHGHAHSAGPSHDDGHVHHAAIVEWLNQTNLSPEMRARAQAIFALLAQAEGEVHGIPPAMVQFHEVGAWDSIVDIVSAAFLIEAIGPADWTHSPAPLGGGTVETAHGTLPVPAPATLRLLQGLPVIDDGIMGERVTPTGAAILRHLHTSRGTAAGRRVMVAGRGGLGFGSRQLDGRANVLRACVFFSPEPCAAEEQSYVQRIEFDVDDQPAEDLAVGLEKLRVRDDVLQIVQIPVFGKKGRLTSRIELLVRDDAADAVANACFSETSTIGLRVQRVERRVLPRTELVLRNRETHDERVKVSIRPDGTPVAKAEMDDLASIRGGYAERQRARHRTETRALSADEKSDGH